MAAAVAARMDHIEVVSPQARHGSRAAPREVAEPPTNSLATTGRARVVGAAPAGRPRHGGVRRRPPPPGLSTARPGGRPYASRRRRGPGSHPSHRPGPRAPLGRVDRPVALICVDWLELCFHGRARGGSGPLRQPGAPDPAPSTPRGIRPVRCRRSTLRPTSPLAGSGQAGGLRCWRRSSTWNSRAGPRRCGGRAACRCRGWRQRAAACARSRPGTRRRARRGTSGASRALGAVAGVVVVDLVVVPGHDPGHGGVRGLQVGVGLVERVAARGSRRASRGSRAGVLAARGRGARAPS